MEGIEQWVRALARNSSKDFYGGFSFHEKILYDAKKKRFRIDLVSIVDTIKVCYVEANGDIKRIGKNGKASKCVGNISRNPPMSFKEIYA